MFWVTFLLSTPGLSHPFLGMGPGPMELGKLVEFLLKLENLTSALCIKFNLINCYQIVIM